MKLDKSGIQNIWRAIVKRISPIEISGGLVVSDAALRYVRFNERDTVEARASLRLPPGAVVQGKINNHAVVSAALHELRERIGIPSSRGAGVILSLDSGAVYSQLFNLPQLEESSLAEAAELNIQMVSPIDTKTSYHSYQVVGKSENGTGGYELLGAFIGMPVVDDWISACKTAGFLPIAVEFQALSIARAVSEFADIGLQEIALVLDVSSEGMDLVVVKNGNLYFDYFYPWKLIQGEDKSISMDKFKQILIAETGKVMNFTLSKFGGETKSIWINAENIGAEMITALKMQYSSVPVSEITVQEKRVPPLWLSALGAGKRGMLLRSEDDLISLSPRRVVTEYMEHQMVTMIKLWRNVFAITLSFFLLVFCIGDLFLRQIRLSAGQQSFRNLSPEESRELSVLRGKADEFNALVSFVAEAKAEENKVYPFISKIINLGNNVQITRLSFQGITEPVVLNGNAPSADAVVQFQRRLAETPNITDLQFPLSSLTTAPNGRTAFVMSFRITNLDF
ncbi:MAG: pilus assembly protein PilM [Parcubacteria group bacterium]